VQIYAWLNDLVLLGCNVLPGLIDYRIYQVSEREDDRDGARSEKDRTSAHRIAI
jgi:hypothetical protein